jgi:hypothetical protein
MGCVLSSQLAFAVLGHILILGEFDECLGLRRQNNVTGQLEPAANYCLTRISHPGLQKLPTLPAYGVCLPVECANGQDSNAFVTGLFRTMKAASQVEVVKVMDSALQFTDLLSRYQLHNWFWKIRRGIFLIFRVFALPPCRNRWDFTSWSH